MPESSRVDMAIWFRWLGVAGFELHANGRVLAVDPFLTRPPFWRMLFGGVHPDHDLIGAKVGHCDWILVTHPHWDHLMDVPDIVRGTGATALGSANTCALLAACGVPKEQICPIREGDQLALDLFRVEVLPAEHIPVPGFGPGSLHAGLQPPLRLHDYRLDRCFSFLIHMGGLRLLDWCSARPEPACPADVLLLRPYESLTYYEPLLSHVHPRLVIPVHWDDLFRPLSKPLRPMLEPPRPAWPPLRRIDLRRFAREIQHTAPETRVLIPEVFHCYDLSALCSG